MQHCRNGECHVAWNNHRAKLRAMQNAHTGNSGSFTVHMTAKSPDLCTCQDAGAGGLCGATRILAKAADAAMGTVQSARHSLSTHQLLRDIDVTFLLVAGYVKRVECLFGLGLDACRQSDTYG